MTYAPRFSFDATYHKGVIVAIDIVDGPDGRPFAKVTVESAPVAERRIVRERPVEYRLVDERPVEYRRVEERRRDVGPPL